MNKKITSIFFLGASRPKRLYFVVFYGSTADFAWVPDAAIISYQGVEAFTKYAQEIVDKVFDYSLNESIVLFYINFERLKQNLKKNN